MAEGYAGAQMGAQHPNYGNQSSVPGAPKVERPMTELEQFTSQLADTARRLTITADRMQGRVDSFMQAAQAIGKDHPPTPEPQPGTLSAMRYWHKQIDEQSSRLADTAANLAGII